jgi:DNA-binding NarL/FixJ family response regulator
MHKEFEILCQTCSSETSGYMLKDDLARELLPALHTLVQDKVYLSPSMATEVPDACWMKVTAQRGLPASTAKHCEKIIRDSGANAASAHP